VATKVTGAGGTAGATGAMTIGQGLSRASGRAGEKEGPTPGEITKPTPRAWLQAGGLNIMGRDAPWGLHAPGDAAGILARSGCRRGTAP